MVELHGWLASGRNGAVGLPVTHPFLDHPGPLPFVHRGGALEAFENTWAAFEQAVAMGYRYVETDVRATADGVLLAFHDASLGRVTDRDGVIRRLPWTEVTQARVRGREPIPTLDDLLAAFPDVRFNLDAKDASTLRPLARLLRDPQTLARVCVGSFSDRRLAWLRTALGVEVCTSLATREVFRLKRAAVRGRRVELPPSARCVQVPVGPPFAPLLDGRFVDAAHAHGLAVHAWTIDRPEQMAQLLDLGVDGIMTDRPAELRRVLVERGQWAGMMPP
jgi:glycerophosphoryl diester phosphodiesterase